MANSSVLNGRVDVTISANSGTISAPAGGRNFILNANPADIANYARQGSDLIIEFANGQTVTIENFFTGQSHNLVLSNADVLQLVDFSHAMAAGGDGIVDAAIAYDGISTAVAGGGSSVGTLLGVLGGLAAIGGIAAAASGGKDDDNTAVTPPPSPAPDPIFVKAQPTLSGDQRTPGEIIKIYSEDGTIFYGDTTVDANGEWEITITQSLGAHGDEVKLQLTTGGALGDNADTGTKFLDITVTIDTVAPAAPELTSVTDADGNEIAAGTAVSTDKITLKGTAEPNSTVEITYSGGLRETVDVPASGEWEKQIDVPLEQEYTFTITTEDEAGNISAEKSFTVTIDTTAPTAKASLQSISEDSGVDAFASDLITIFKQDQTFTFKSDNDYAADEKLQIKIGNGDWQAATYDNDATVWHYEYSGNLDIGDNTIESRFIDGAGNLGAVRTATVKVLDYTAYSGSTSINTLNFDSDKTDLLTFSVLEGNATGGNEAVTINGFDRTNKWGDPDGSDRIDISALLIGYDSDNKGDFVKVTDATDGGDITIAIDRDGSDTTFNMETDFITLVGVGTGLTSLDDLIDNGWLYLG